MEMSELLTRRFLFLGDLLGNVSCSTERPAPGLSMTAPGGQSRTLQTLRIKVLSTTSNRGPALYDAKLSLGGYGWPP